MTSERKYLVNYHNKEFALIGDRARVGNYIPISPWWYHHLYSPRGFLYCALTASQPIPRTFHPLQRYGGPNLVGVHRRASHRVV